MKELKVERYVLQNWDENYETFLEERETLTNQVSFLIKTKSKAQLKSTRIQTTPLL